MRFREAVAFTGGVPADGALTYQTLRVEIPAEAPFSHDGNVLSYIWTATATEVRGGFDQTAEQPIRVLP